MVIAPRLGGVAPLAGSLVVGSLTAHRQHVAVGTPRRCGIELPSHSRNHGFVHEGHPLSHLTRGHQEAPLVLKPEGLEAAVIELTAHRYHLVGQLQAEVGVTLGLKGNDALPAQEIAPRRGVLGSFQ